MRSFEERSKQPLDILTLGNRRKDGLAMFALVKTILQGTVKGERIRDRRGGGKTILKSELASTLPAQIGQLKRRQGGKRLLRSHHLLCADDQGIGIEQCLTGRIARLSSRLHSIYDPINIVNPM